MGIVSSTELATVSASRRFGEPPVFQRKWIVEVSDPATPQTDIVNAIGVVFLDAHPEANYCLAQSVSVGNANGSRWHYEVTWDYELPKVGKDNAAVNPLARADIWSFSTGAATVPALVYYHGATNNDKRPLVNSAGDWFEGVTTDEAEVRCTITGNRAKFPLSLAVAVTNSINNDNFLGAEPYQWKCQGLGAQFKVEVVEETEVKYWEVTAELVYRQSGWRQMLPDVGWNYLDGGIRKRAYVEDPDTGERVPSSNPQPLNENGTLKPGTPDILFRRVHPAVEFQSMFGRPPAGLGL
jgi:hypothetical protein